MKQIDERHYKANKYCFIVRKSDNFIMGEDIDLGSADSIDNYEDQPYTEESYNQFYESLGLEPPKHEKENEEENQEESQS